MGAAVSFVRAQKRFYTYGRDYFNHVTLPSCKDLVEAIGISHADAGLIFDAFVAMDTDGSGQICTSEFHRYFGLKRGVFTERVFDTYAALQQGEGHSDEDDELLSFEEFVVCVWNYASFDASLMATYLWGIFDIDKKETLSVQECDALMRMVWYNQPDDACAKAMETIRSACDGSAISLQTFTELIVADNSIVQPAFDIQANLIEKTTGDKKDVNGKSCWELYRERRRVRFGSVELPEISFNGKTISSSAHLESAEHNNSNLTEEFIATLFKRVERHLEAPEGYDTRLEEERYIDKCRDALNAVEQSLSNDHFSIDRVEKRKELRQRLWSLLEEIKDAQIDALEAERERDLGILERYQLNPDEDQPLEYSSEDALHELFDGLIDSFDSSWKAFVDSYEERFGPATTSWEKLYDPDQNLSFYFNWQSGERCYDQQLGNLPPAICEVCDSLIQLTEYKCFHCDAPRSERNKLKYRGRVSLKSMAAE